MHQLVFKEDFKNGFSQWAGQSSNMQILDDCEFKKCKFQLNKKIGNRNELKLSLPLSNLAFDKYINYSLDFFIPEEFGLAPEWRIFTQFHDSWDIPLEIKNNVSEATYKKYYKDCLYMQCPPPLAIIFYGPQLELQVTELGEGELKFDSPIVETKKLCYLPPETLKIYRYKLCEIKRSQWNKIKIKVLWSLDKTGHIMVYINDNLVGEHIGPNIYNSRRNYWKIGYYRSSVIKDDDYLFLANPTIIV